MIRNELKTGPWNLTDLKHVKSNGMKVFSCFCCGGGSTMGYKLAGFDVLGGVEIDPEIANIYRANHNPKHFYRMGVADFNKIPNDKLPKELFNLDILDGSPPCSSFSMAGSREKKWGVKKKFREGQTEQVLDDLFFHFIDTAKKLNPKVVVAENVKGLIQGNARGYVKQIFKGFKDASYTCQLFLLNAAAMGVPQKRERTFFIANRLGKKISLGFHEDVVSVKTATKNCLPDKIKIKIAPRFEKYWKIAQPGQTIRQAANVTNKWFGYAKIDPNKPSIALVSANKDKMYHWNEWRALYKSEWLRLQTFPDDYICLNGVDVRYICGMSVPPFMAQRIADQIYVQLLYEGD